MEINIIAVVLGIGLVFGAGYFFGYESKKSVVERGEWLKSLAQALIDRGERIIIREGKDNSLEIDTWQVTLRGEDSKDIGRFYWCPYDCISDALERSGCFRSLSVEEAYALRDLLLRSPNVEYYDERLKKRKREERGRKFLEQLEE